jgi:iron complex transport system permease protein
MSWSSSIECPRRSAISTGSVQSLAPVASRFWIYALLCAAVVSLFLLEMVIGSVEIPVKSVVSILLGGERTQQAWSAILFELRLPRAVTAMLAGAGLAVCGLQLQTLFRNPLAGPWAMGITAGAQVGAAVIVVSTGAIGPTFLRTFQFAADLSIVTGAGLGSLAVMLLVLLAARRVNAVTLLILGLMLQFMAQGVVSVLLHFANESMAKVYGSWNEANYGAVTWDRLSNLAPVLLAGLLAANLFAKPLNALLMGETYARTLGVNVVSTRFGILASVIVTAGAVTAYCGPVSFLDIIVPQICRGLLRTADHRWLMPATVLVGGILGLSGDLLINLPWEQHFLHLNAVHALIGGPVVLWLIFGRRSNADTV